MEGRKEGRKERRKEGRRDGREGSTVSPPIPQFLSSP
jgi:hypothetical protein